MMRRVMRVAALVLAALAPIACATEGGVLQGGADLFDEEEQRTAAASTAASPGELDALQSQAEDAYRARRFDDAVTRYERLLASQPSNAHAWLRLGNVHHHRRDWFKALSAYRRAAARTQAGVETEPSLRAKAIYNVALINLELARQSLRSLERLGEGVNGGADPAPLAREIDRTQRQLEAVSTSERGVRGASRP